MFPELWHISNNENPFLFKNRAKKNVENERHVYKIVCHLKHDFGFKNDNIQSKFVSFALLIYAIG